ncbi:MAG: hypothetical protein ACE5G2_00680 [Candidatus Krumholzibacteriia bacterium]
MHKPPRSAYAGIFLASSATLLLQITYTRILSAAIWYHFAFLVVSIALFGFGASGVGLALVSPGDRDRKLQVWAPALFGISTIASYLATRVIPFSPFKILREPVQVWYFLLYDLLLLMPFLFAGATVALLLRRFPRHAGGLYAFDLVGAALGSLLVFVALPLVGAPGAVFLAGALAFASAACLGPERRTVLALAGLTALSLAPLLAPERIPDVRVDDTKVLPVYENDPRGTVIFTAWNALSRIDVVEVPDTAPRIFIDCAAMTPLAPPHTNLKPEEAQINAAAYLLKDDTAAVIIGSGGGQDVQDALALGAVSVTAVEINPTIIDIVTRRFKDRVGDVFADPRVHLVRDEGRSFIDRSAVRADIIQISLIDTWAASASGAYSLTENYLYTTEAFRAYLEHLDRDGVLSITRWHYEAPRLAALGRAALESMGVRNPSRHVLVLEKGIHTNFMMKRDPFAAGEVRRMRDYATHIGATLVHDPMEPQERTVYDILLSHPDPQRVLAKWPVLLEPVGDDNPFFFQMGRWQSLNLEGLRKFSGKNFLEPLALPVGQIALLTALGLAVILSCILLVIPLIRRAVPRERRMQWLGYFLGLGLAFIVVEVVLMQRFALFLGHPTYSVTTVLFAILLFSGLGSAVSSNRKGTTAVLIRPVLWLLPIAILLLTFGVPQLTRALIGMPHVGRLLVAIAIIAPIAFLMGMPFPTGIRAVAASNPAHVPWAWAANGCASVVGSVCAVLGAMASNFSTMLVTACVIYFLALIGLSRMNITVE